MIIKSERAIVDTDTYDSFYIEADCNKEYHLLAVNKYTSETIILYSNENKENVEKLLETLYGKFVRNYNCMDIFRLKLIIITAVKALIFQKQRLSDKQ